MRLSAVVAHFTDEEAETGKVTLEVTEEVGDWVRIKTRSSLALIFDDHLLGVSFPPHKNRMFSRWGWQNTTPLSPSLHVLLAFWNFICGLQMLNEFLGNSWERRVSNHLWAGKNSVHYSLTARALTFCFQQLPVSGPTSHALALVIIAL